MLGGIVTGSMAAGIAGASAFQIGNFINIALNSRTLVRFRPKEGGVIKLRKQDLLLTRLRPDAGEPGFKVQIRKGRKKRWYFRSEARSFAGAILPRLNAMGGTKETVRHAVHQIENAGHPERFLSSAAAEDRFHDWKGIRKMPKPTKLALEMALHEEQERRALEGELWCLERAWQEAEEIAEISDSLFLPEGA